MSTFAGGAVGAAALTGGLTKVGTANGAFLTAAAGGTALVAATFGILAMMGTAGFCTAPCFCGTTEGCCWTTGLGSGSTAAGLGAGNGSTVSFLFSAGSTRGTGDVTLDTGVGA